MPTFDIAKLYSGETVKPLGIQLGKLRTITSSKSRADILAILSAEGQTSFKAFLDEWKTLTANTGKQLDKDVKSLLERHRSTLKLVDGLLTQKAKDDKRKANEAKEQATIAHDKEVADRAREQGRRQLLAEVGLCNYATPHAA